MSDWLDEVAQEMDAKRRNTDQIELETANSFNMLDGQISGILQEAVDFVNEEGTFKAGEIYLKTTAPPQALPGWVIYQNWEGMQFSLQLHGIPPHGYLPIRLYVNGFGKNGQDPDPILVSEYSDDWLRAQVLPVVRRMLKLGY